MLNMNRFDPMQHDTPGADLMALIQLARESAIEDRQPRAIEVGTWAGLSAKAILEGLEQAARLLGGASQAPFDSSVQLLCVDHWLGNPNDRLGEIAREYGQPRALGTFCQNLAGDAFRRVFPLVGDSATWATILAASLPSKVPLVFIDANHDREAVDADIRLWLPLVSSRGILAGHDYGVFPGVTEAVDAAFGASVKRIGKTIWYVHRAAVSNCRT